MTQEIRIVQFFKLETATEKSHRFQNYFVGQKITFGSLTYSFAPFSS